MDVRCQVNLYCDVCVISQNVRVTSFCSATYGILLFRFSLFTEVVKRTELNVHSCFHWYNKKLISYRRDSAGRRSLRRSRSFKITDFGTNRKPACDFLLLNNTNLYPISHRFPVTAHTVIIAFDKGCLSLMRSFSLISAKVAICHIYPKNQILWTTFLSQKVWAIFNQFYVIGSQFGRITQNNGHYAVQGHWSRYQSKAHMRLLISD